MTAFRGTAGSIIVVCTLAEFTFGTSGRSVNRSNGNADEPSENWCLRPSTAAGNLYVPSRMGAREQVLAQFFALNYH